ncbi:MAG: hypothetical protein A3G00_02840 [Candidatus Magasanikbacteria bacterium RIFCSPLOWO2_12_FULL_43_12]|uniref:DUF3592 domain-containing protein n=1 Tax=Candidatus Magasanikbacteria bacterium RIFCSPLOWO2_12_FULL_43_12 TaxID=1798692 RepID=A0A1F6MRH0_9BACT|nr:MAG: hypothetical protein A3I93_00335 [Candidatus Magasanikbacteria bacterium RIFCSPLOWO2_02_FULL_43_22]OGH72029.1 MAG: hypothetical protein A3C74_01160 [Candidatus Magasanikbacteria bacterium RIFCSPHIGHO2_02_FULL_44_13]OGH74227.1 MAG: hypothetical protein A3G00_02840 [Candidatus Magasanikbacteria bacterium RIFCSPLOWO2_12_FULL_43_12]
MKKHFLWIFGGIFSIVGIGLLIGAIYSFTSTASFLKTAATADGTVISLKYVETVKETCVSTNDGMCVGGSTIGGNYYPIIEFRLPDETVVSFRSKVGSNPAPHLVSDKVRVLYDPANPDNAQLEGFANTWLLPIILGSIGLVCSVVGLVTIFFAVKKRQLKQWLKQNGKHITAEITQISVDESITINGRHPNRIFSQYKNPEDKKTYIFKSDALWDNPLPSKTVDVVVDPADYKRYFVDLG